MASSTTPLSEPVSRLINYTDSQGRKASLIVTLTLRSLRIRRKNTSRVLNIPYEEAAVRSDLPPGKKFPARYIQAEFRFGWLMDP